MDQRFEWTEQADAQLIEMQQQGLSYTEIAAKLGCGSRCAVGGRLMRLRDLKDFGPKAKAPKPSSMAERIAQRDRRTPGVAHVPLIKARLEEGKTDREIAMEIGLRPDDVRYVRRTRGFSAGTRVPERPVYAADVARLVGEGLNDRSVSEALGLTIWQARLERRRQGLKSPVAEQSQRQPVTNITKGDPGLKVEKVFSEGFMGQRSRIDFMDMPRLGLCRFPIDQPDGSLRYCGDSVGEGSVYCPHHAARCYTAAPPVKHLRPSHVYTSRR